MQLKKISCYLCGGKKNTLISNGVRDNPNMNVLKCNDCGLVFLNSIGHITPDFYQNSGMHGDSNQSIDSWMKDTHADDIRRYEQYRSIITNKRVLDFGCGNGGFLNLAKNRGGHPQINATGVEATTLLGASLVEQVLTMNVESPRL